MVCRSFISLSIHLCHTHRVSLKTQNFMHSLWISQWNSNCLFHTKYVVTMHTRLFFSVRCELSLNIIHCRLLESSKCITVTYICDNLVVCGLKVLPLCKLRACDFVYSHACDIQSLTCFFVSFVCSRQSSVPLLPTKHQKTAPVAEGWVHECIFRVKGIWKRVHLC
jgi:hypothetical protein